MNIKPLFDRVFIKPLEPETATASGIFLATTRKSENKGLVIAIGPGKKVGDVFIPTTLKVGDRVIVSRKADATIVDYEGVKYFVCHESDVDAVIE